jgi:AraC-like DNA-binding protein
MSIFYEERPSDSPYIETVTHGWTEGDGSTIRPAEIHWHMVFVKLNSRILPFVVGPLTTSGVATFAEAEIIWVRFKLGTFMPHLPIRELLDVETVLPEASSKSFWLKSSAWQFPNFENVETFVDRLVREEVLVSDPLVNAALQDHLTDVPSRTVRHRFLQATGLTQSHIRQMKRAQQAEMLLRQGISILDTVHEVGYFDQSHLTRSLRQFIGYTPAQIIRMSQRACQSAQAGDFMADYHANALETVNSRQADSRC